MWAMSNTTPPQTATGPTLPAVPRMNVHTSRRGSRSESETETRRVRRYRAEHCDELEHMATELNLIAVATREHVSTVARHEQWALGLSSVRLALRLLVGSLERNDTPHINESNHPELPYRRDDAPIEHVAPST